MDISTELYNNCISFAKAMLIKQKSYNTASIDPLDIVHEALVTVEELNQEEITKGILEILQRQRSQNNMTTSVDGHLMESSLKSRFEIKGNLKVCAKCGDLLPESGFRVQIHHNDGGRKTIVKYCIPCERELKLAHYHENRLYSMHMYMKSRRGKKELIDSIKRKIELTGKEFSDCKNCGLLHISNFNIYEPNREENLNNPNRTIKYYPKSLCIPCSKEYLKKWRANNPEKNRKTQDALIKRRKEKASEKWLINQRMKSNIAELADWYVRDVIKKDLKRKGLPLSTPITDKMMIEKRKAILLYREKAGTRLQRRKKTDTEIVEQLSDAYIRSKIVRSYKERGVTPPKYITKRMMLEKRRSILGKRERKVPKNPK